MLQFNFIYSFREVVEELICKGTYDGQPWEKEPTLKNVLFWAKDYIANIGLRFDGLPFITFEADDFVVNEHVENLWQLLKARYYNS